MLKHKFIYLRITNFQALKPTIKENHCTSSFCYLIFGKWYMYYSMICIFRIIASIIFMKLRNWTHEHSYLIFNCTCIIIVFTIFKWSKFLFNKYDIEINEGFVIWLAMIQGSVVWDPITSQFINCFLYLCHKHTC